MQPIFFPVVALVALIGVRLLGIRLGWWRALLVALLGLATAGFGLTAVRERVGLLQVLGREQHRRLLPGELADNLPQGPAAGRVESRGRLVKEQHVRAGDQTRCEVELTGHPAGVHDPPQEQFMRAHWRTLPSHPTGGRGGG
jgi:hypothetical protein